MTTGDLTIKKVTAADLGGNYEPTSVCSEVSGSKAASTTYIYVYSDYPSVLG